LIEIDCREIPDQVLALATYIGDRSDGVAVPLVKNDRIVFDEIVPGGLDLDATARSVGEFITENDLGCTLTVENEVVVVHSPILRKRSKNMNTLPPGLLQCPYCSYVTQYQEELTVHTRAHLFGVA
jgi:hypothetical protein